MIKRSQKPAVHQLLHTLSYGDAISGEVLALARILRDLGFESEVFALNVHPKLKHCAKPASELKSDFSGEVVFHFSLGSPLNDLYRSMANAKRTLLYHNLTPPKWFSRVNPRVTNDIEQGARELPELCRISDRVIADSTFNAEELRPFGVAAEVLPLPMDDEKWGVAANSGIESLLRGEDAIHVMHVGRIAPNKCIEDIIKVFYFLHHKLHRKSRLWLPGIDIDTELYSFSLKRLVQELDLVEVVHFVGCMADSEIKALYQNSSVYLCMSEHEGFCVPIVEAMHFGCPVIAYASSAIPETLGSGGVLVREKRHPEIAELILEIYRNQDLKAGLVEAGKFRATAFTLQEFRTQVEELFPLATETEIDRYAAGAE
jgi:glycosyltransferase involved in cell wall biosynthesis